MAKGNANIGRMRRERSEEARRRLPALLDDARRGRTTLITRHGVPCAAIVPVSVLDRQPAGMRIEELRGSGKGLWAKNVPRWINEIRKEWD